MCGIFGFVTDRGDVAGRIDVRAALRALAHRGPDGEGTFSGTVGSTYCALAHTRLAIIDLSDGGRQPMRSHDGRYVITYNGEFYNHREVRQELESEGVVLRTTSDTEVLIHAYATWGPACLGRLRGMFAFAIWDTQLGDLFLARDRLGIKPLYVALSADGLAFASEVRALLAAGAVRPRLSAEGIRSYLEWGSVAEPSTILEGVAMLPPGTFLSFRQGRATSSGYWRPRLHPTRTHSFDEAVEEIAPILREAVKLRLVSDVPVGIFLSGGVDSSVITAIASSESPRPLQTFTVAFEEQAMNEGDRAAAVAARFGCEHHTILLRPDELKDELDNTLRCLDQPSSDGTNTFFVAKAVRSAGISVALSGLGGDELFAGYQYFRQFPMAVRMAGMLPPSAGGWLSGLVAAGALSWLPPRIAKLAALLSGEDSPTGAYAALRCMFTPAQIRELLPGSVTSAPSRTALWGGSAELPSDLDQVNAFSVLDLSHYMRNTLLRDADVMSMAHGLEVRLPLIDHRLVECVLPIAGRLKISPEMNKPLLVRSSPAVPSRLAASAKMGFTLPFEEWLRGPLRARMDDLLAPSSIGRLGFLSVDAVQRLWAAFLARDRRVTYSRVWCLAALVAWCKENRAIL